MQLDIQKWMMINLRFFFIFALVVNLHSVKSQCASEHNIGEPKTKDEDKSDYSKETVNAVLNLKAQYQFQCCGFIKAWEIFVSKDSVAGRNVKVQVWYKDVAGNDWNLRGENIIEGTNVKQVNVKEISTGFRIRPFFGDYIAFYEYAGSVITYDDGGGTGDYKIATFTSDHTTFDWDSVGVSNNRDHAIHARVTPSIAPTFTNLDDTVAISNNDVAGTVVFSLATIDTDPEDVGLLTIAAPTSPDSALTYFELDHITLEVKIKSGVSLVPGDHLMEFTVSDLCSKSSSSILTIRVENDPPVITSLSTSSSTTISEDLSSETLLHTLIVTDTQPTTCRLLSTGVPFVIKRISGSTNYGIFLSTGASLDYEAQNAYVLDLSCTDNYDDTAGIYTVYLIQNEPPSINGLPRATDIQEDVIVETTLYTFSVTDPENTVVTCSVTAITPTTNIIFMKPSTNFNEFDIILQSNPSLRYDLIRTYRIDIQCNDGRRSDSSVFFMNILRNKPPVFLNLQNITSVSSIATYIGQIVFDVDITDPENDQVEFSMFCVPSANCPFEIYHSGEIVLKRSIEGEFIPAYDLYVYVTDGKSTTGPRSLTVHVLDINYVPVIRNLPLPSALVVSENSALGLSIFQVSIQDNDGADTHTYTMTSSPSDGVLYFDINSANGLVSTSASTNINFEGVSSTSFTFTITVTDTKDSASQNLSISIANQNEAPVFTKKAYALSVDEGVAGTTLADPSYLYQDGDNGDTHTFSMTCASNVGYFAIAPATGLITLATDIDVDAAGSATSFTCTLVVSDGSFTDSASLTITVNNINDNTPRFSNNLFTYYLDINYPLNTAFGSTVATDADTGTFGNFIYSIDQTSLGTETFGIQTNGDLYLKNSLTSYGYGSSISFTVQATDTGSLQGTSTIFIVIPQTTTTTTTTTDRPITFWEYPANPAWVIVAGILGLIIMVLPCYMCYKNGFSCTWRGRPGDYRERIQESSEIRNTQNNNTKGNGLSPTWKAWKWYEQQ
ncbi:protocadherin Fat 4-like isoform X2 [Mytilus californianus]|uniref:protocadherin Fat 4-like isoform X2 n=1 Tax=Mytilus californianus TaxID=6549 RepID=UPI0022468BDC|nr:protocadherin Fat 4-like isoform X2 [Mytilus californianus]